MNDLDNQIICDLTDLIFDDDYFKRKQIRNLEEKRNIKIISSNEKSQKILKNAKVSEELSNKINKYKQHKLKKDSDKEKEKGKIKNKNEIEYNYDDFFKDSGILNDVLDIDIPKKIPKEESSVSNGKTNDSPGKEEVKKVNKNNNNNSGRNFLIQSNISFPNKNQNNFNIKNNFNADNKLSKSFNPINNSKEPIRDLSYKNGSVSKDINIFGNNGNNFYKKSSAYNHSSSQVQESSSKKFTSNNIVNNRNNPDYQSSKNYYNNQNNTNNHDSKINTKQVPLLSNKPDQNGTCKIIKPLKHLPIVSFDETFFEDFLAKINLFIKNININSDLPEEEKSPNKSEEVNPFVSFYKSSIEDPQLKKHLLIHPNTKLSFLRKFPDRKKLVTQNGLFNILNNSVERVINKNSISIDSYKGKEIPKIEKNLYYVKLIKDAGDKDINYHMAFVTENVLKKKMNLSDLSPLVEEIIPDENRGAE